MSKDYLNDNSLLFKSYLERNWFPSWKLPRGEDLNQLKGIEIFLTTDCNLSCSYCYLNRYEDELYPSETKDMGNILHNVNILIDWLIDNKYTPSIDFFSGSPLSSELGFKTLELLYDKYKNVPLELRPPNIVVPTNYSWMLREEMIDRVQNILDKIESIDIPIFLSASVEGKYMEVNRPFRTFERIAKTKSELFRPETDERDDEFYHKVFQYNRDTGAGFHPMVYSNNIEHWKKNFVWYQEMFEEYDITHDNLYLLEVRNEEWSEKQLQYFTDFIDFLIKWSWEKEGKNPERYIDFLFRRRGYNILTNTASQTGRGTGCSLQTTLYVRAGDLAIVGCHRQSYDGYEWGKFIVEDDKIIDIEGKNVEFALAMSQMDATSLPYCEGCRLKNICMGPCHGSSLEYLGDPFTPIPTVCELVYRKTAQMIKSFKEIGFYDHFLEIVDQEIRGAFTYVEKEIGNEF